MEDQLKLIPQNEVDAAFMEELKDAVRDRNATLDEVIALIRSEKVTWPSQQVDMPSEELVELIEALKS